MEPLHLHKSTSPALSQDDAEERIVVVLFSCDSGMHVPKQLYNNNNNDRLTAFDPGQPG